MTDTSNRRLLIVDDTAGIHEDFRKVLGLAAPAQSASTSENALFDEVDAAPANAAQAEISYTIDSAFQGEQALERVIAARKDNLPYALAFVDMRMPPGWDGVQTIRKLWEVEPDLQVVVCTAFSDYTWPEMVAHLGRSDRLLILKKPFDAVEVCQLAAALTEKWNVTADARRHLQSVVRAELEARAYASSLETVNRALESSWAQAENELKRKREFVLSMATEVLAPTQALLLKNIDLAGLERGDGAALAALDAAGDHATSIVGAIATIIELAAIDAGSVRADHAPCSIGALAEEICASARRQAAGKPVTIACRRLPGVPATITSDEPRVRRVLTELVGNALRNTAHGTVHVEGAPQGVLGSPPSAVRITISDTGSGLSRESYAHLFEPFAGALRGTNVDARAGLGLALCKRTATLLGGELNYEPRDEPGAQFALVLPLNATNG